MKSSKIIRSILLAAGLLMSFQTFAATPEKSFNAPYNLKVTVKQIGPVTQSTDLQIITFLKHSASDKYIEAMDDFNAKQGDFIKNIRSRGEFVGEQGETLLYTPPANSITPTQVLLIGLGDEKELSLDKLQLAGKIALREATRLGAKHVSFAPMLRDQGNSQIDVAEGDAAIVEQLILAYDTEKRLQSQGLAKPFSIDEWVIEAGPKFYDAVNTKVDAAILKAKTAIDARSASKYVNHATH
ncbi:M17 family peptidase N-terminal domain-containing protein [Methylobacillus glycogenes]|uniref:M17 family peptidase N-terminal domain-containing protein n=1 Tax=Methylobacillus glycogenes TaxID=406 RepID=UPI00046EBAF7|nr:M17 family peptidase N-terminal domain-containing protein [Methylobacillus glycogenes]